MVDDGRDDLAWRIEELYDWYGRPLEAEHSGEYLVVAGHGEYVFGPDEQEIAREALERFGPGCWLFRIEQISGRGKRAARQLKRG